MARISRAEREAALRKKNSLFEKIKEEPINEGNSVDQTIDAFEGKEAGEKRQDEGKGPVLIDVTDKSRVGRPKMPGEFKNISVRLKKENYEKARLRSGRYGSMTAYINWLIEKD